MRSRRSGVGQAIAVVRPITLRSAATSCVHARRCAVKRWRAVARGLKSTHRGREADPSGISQRPESARDSGLAPLLVVDTAVPVLADVDVRAHRVASPLVCSTIGSSSDQASVRARGRGPDARGRALRRRARARAVVLGVRPRARVLELSSACSSGLGAEAARAPVRLRLRLRCPSGWRRKSAAPPTARSTASTRALSRASWARSVRRGGTTPGRLAPPAHRTHPGLPAFGREPRGHEATASRSESTAVRPASLRLRV